MTGSRWSEDRLRHELQALEDSAPFDTAPSTDSARSGVMGAAIASLVVVVALVAGAFGIPALVAWKESPTPVPSASSVPSATASVSPSAYPTPSESVASPDPREGWVASRVTTDRPYVRIRGIAEARGVLFALGSAGRNAPGIWWSRDGRSWVAASVPSLPADLGGNVVALVDGGQLLVALATIGDAEGSGPFGAAIYTSSDGSTWDLSTDTPGMTAPSGTALFDLVVDHGRLVAVGNDAVWLSDDVGLSWTKAAGSSSISGRMVSVAVVSGQLMAVGRAGTGDTAEGPALVWQSSDRGETWTRAVLNEGREASAIAAGSTGRIVVTGSGLEGPLAWVSTTGGRSWVANTVPTFMDDVVATDTGFVGVSRISSTALMSVSGLEWTAQAIPVQSQAVGWGREFGLVAAGDPNSVALGPVPAPVLRGAP